MSPRVQERALRSVRDLGWMPDATLESILKAGQHAVNPQHLIEFGLRFSRMERSGVPVADAIEMIVDAGERVNLLWSGRRWQQEHDQHVRLLAARKLTEQAGADGFDTSWLDRALPPPDDPKQRFIQVLRTPSCLAAEGARQSHCISGKHYVEAFRRGTLGGVSVLDKDDKRWTVTIAPGSGGARPSVSRIHGRFNSVPNRSVKRWIADVLGSGVIPAPETAPPARASPAEPSLFPSRGGVLIM